jgi:hypothetical protein
MGFRNRMTLNSQTTNGICRRGRQLIREILYFNKLNITTAFVAVPNFLFFSSFFVKHIKVKVEDSFQCPLVLKVEDNRIFRLFMRSLSLIYLISL